MDLSIIIVNYNTKKLLKQTLESIFDKQIPLQFEVFVSDNGSKDGSIEMLKKDFKQVRLIENNANLGFAKANNIAIKQSTGRYVLLLNSDTVIVDDCLQKCTQYMDAHTDTGALGCKVTLPQGGLDAACKRSFPTPEVSFYRMTGLSKIFPKSKRFGQYNLTYLDEDAIHSIDCLVGAFMMVRRQTLEQVGLLDEDFFMYGEDVDWCYRIKNAGWDIIYYPEAQIIHHKGGSTNAKNPKIVYEFHRAMYLFYKKHYAAKYNFLTTACVYTAIALKLAISLFINKIRIIMGGRKK